jgi:hypothetical protein
MRVPVILIFLAQFFAHAELVDRIAIVVGKSIIKDSDIDRDIRVTQFLNNEPLHIASAKRQEAARKLIDQVFLREEIRTGDYPAATDQEINSQLAAVGKNRFATEAAFRTALAKYDLDEPELREQVRWQLTVLHFIEERFKPAVIVQDSAAEEYVRQHESALRKNNPGASAEDLRSQARDVLTGEEVNRLLFSWLDERRKDSKISFHEDGLL